ncbi:high affinity immunoglobulin gamma Fc receptor I-like [Oryzias melastigma]|uniref:high affinity immunoglobulin gamma Fc receptor I-like n=1 Tax=Oryzias melastigma TaxID=30732 RepID=UPI00168D864D|nr:high affinity immunoglobulin gamma Fc receptor I-like [Oryzias melastigma]
MELAALCSVFASLRVLPSRSQFFQYESVTLSCELHGNLSGWRIRRTIDQGNTTEDCPSSSNRSDSVCFIRELYYWDNGVYWSSLRVLPSRSQFFQYESVTLSCELHGNLSGWRIRGTIDQGNTTEDCPSSSNRSDSVCFIRELYYWDNGVYWCESAEGKCSNKVNITVTALDLILEAPVLPVVEGEVVTLGCRNRTSSGFSFFYKNRLLVGNSSTGNWTIERVSKSDEGFYQCSSSGRDYFSPDSWLDVTGERTLLLPYLWFGRLTTGSHRMQKSFAGGSRRAVIVSASGPF